MEKFKPLYSTSVNLDAIREGTPIEKGAVLTTDFLEKHEKKVQELINYFILYPDLFLDTIAPQNPEIRLFFYQRVLLRVFARYRYVSATFTRAFSKSFLAILALMIRCVLLPGSNVFVSSDVKSTSIEIVKEKLTQILNWWPFFEGEIANQHMANDYVDVLFKNGSTLRILTMSANARGLRMSAGVLEEAAKTPGDILNEVIIPTMNVDRRMSNGLVNPEEPHAAQLYITSAGTKACFMYSKMIEIFIMAIIDPDSYFILGGDYRVPVMHGLIGRKQIEAQKLSPTYSEESFMRESMSVWSGDNEESRFKTEKLIRHRTLLRCEREQQITPHNKKAFYVIGVDVARNAANTVFTVAKVLPNDFEIWQKNIVNMRVLHNTSFDIQALELKKLIRAFDPREIIIDINTMGTGLLDWLIKPTLDETTRVTYPAEYVMNDEDYTSKQPKHVHARLYVIKPTSAFNSDVYTNLYTQINGGHVKFLAPERIVKQKLLATKKGQRMRPEKRIQFLLPYEMTSRLMDELINLKLKGTSKNLEVEQITRRIEKDRVSALAYTLWKIKEFGDKAMKERNRKNNLTQGFSSLVSDNSRAAKKSTRQQRFNRNQKRR